ncbi:MAG: hypothetical protein HZB44_10645 [Actinobacteria bacterium]|nr:hypothetical protein [Actinomycetota bacterium]
MLKRIPLPAILLAAAAALTSLILVVSLYGADDSSPSSGLTVGASGYIDDGPFSSPRSDAYPPPVPPESPAPPAEEDETWFAESDGSAEGSGIDPGIPTPPVTPGVTIWQDRSDSGYNAGSGQGAISGRVTDPWGNGIAGVTVSLGVGGSPCGNPGKPGPDLPRWIITPAITDSMGFYAVTTMKWHTGWPYAEEYSFSESYVPNIFSHENEGVPLEGSYTVYFSGTVHGYHSAEWYNDIGRSEPCSVPVGVLSVPAGSSGVDAVLVPQASIAGKVSGPGSESAWIAAVPADGAQAEYVNIGEGAYSYGNIFYLSRLLPGAYKLTAIPNRRGYYDRQERPDPGTPVWFNATRSWDAASNIVLGEGQVATVDFRFPEEEPKRADTISGSLLFHDRPPSYGTEVALVEASNPDVTLARKTLSPSNYSFSFSGLRDGEYKLKCVLPGSGRTFWYIGTVLFFYVEPGLDPNDAAAISPGSENIIFNAMPQGGNVSGTITFPDGSPVPSVNVRADVKNGYIEQWPAISTTDRSGSYAFDYNHGYYYYRSYLMPGNYRICVRDEADGSEYCAADLVSVGWYTDSSGVDIVVPADFGTPMEVSGTVRKPDDSGAGGATVKLIDFNGLTHFSKQADSSGYYRFTRADGLLPGYYYACAEYRGIDYCDWSWRHDGFLVWWNVVLADIDLKVPDEVGADGY